MKTDLLDMGAVVRRILAESSAPDPDARFADRQGGRVPVPVDRDAFVAAFSDHEGDLGMPVAEFVDAMVTGFLDKAPFANRQDGGWALVPAALRTHQAAREVLEESEAYLVEGTLRSLTAKRLGQKVRDTHFWLDLDTEFRASPIDAEHVRGRKGRVWGLGSWRLINDAAVRVLERSGPQRAKDLLAKAVVEARLKEGLVPVFSPEVDKRLVADGGRWDISRPKKVAEAPATSRLETRLRAEVQENVERVVAERDPEVSLSREEVLRRLLGHQAGTQKGGPYLEILDSVMADLEAKGELIRVRFAPDNPWWRKAEGFPAAAGAEADRLRLVDADESSLVGDGGLTTDLLHNLGDPHLYWLDGDFAEDGFPGVEPLLVVTLNDFLDDSVTHLPRPLLNAVRSSLGCDGDWAEFVVETPSGEEVVVLVDFPGHRLHGLAPWVNRAAEAGSVFAMEYRGESRFRLDKVGDVRTPHLEDAEIEFLMGLQEDAPPSAEGLLQAVLRYYPEGLTFNDLFHRVLFVRRHARRELMSALVSSFVFEVRDGRWRQHENRAELGHRLSAAVVPVAGVIRRSWVWRAAAPEPGAAVAVPVPGGDPGAGDMVGLLDSSGLCHGAVRLGGKEGQKKVVAAEVLSWTPVEAEELALEPGEKAAEIDAEVLHDVLVTGEGGLVETEVSAGLRQAFQSFAPEVSINQSATRDLEELEALIEEEGGGLGSLGGLAWQLNEDFTWKAFQRVLDEKYYSREDAVRMDVTAMASWLSQRPLAWDAPTLVLPSGAGELPVALLEALLGLVGESDYIASEEGLTLRTPAGRELLFPWGRLIADERRIERILAKDEALAVDEFLRGWFRHVARLVDPRSLQVRISRLSLHLRGLPGVEVEETGMRAFVSGLRKAGRATLGETSSVTRFSTALADLRGLGGKEVEAVLRQVPSTMAQGGTLVLVTGPGQRVKAAGTVESEVNLGPVTARSYSL